MRQISSSLLFFIFSISINAYSGLQKNIIPVQNLSGPISLGAGLNSFEKNILKNCFFGKDKEEVITTPYEISYSIKAINKIEEFNKTFSGNLALGKILGLSLAKKKTNSKKTQLHLLTFKIFRHRHLQNHTLNDRAKNFFLKSPMKRFFEICGDSYIKSVSEGYELIALIEHKKSSNSSSSQLSKNISFSLGEAIIDFQKERIKQGEEIKIENLKKYTDLAIDLQKNKSKKTEQDDISITILMNTAFESNENIPKGNIRHQLTDIELIEKRKHQINSLFDSISVSSVDSLTKTIQSFMQKIETDLNSRENQELPPIISVSPGDYSKVVGRSDDIYDSQRTQENSPRRWSRRDRSNSRGAENKFDFILDELISGEAVIKHYKDLKNSFDFIRFAINNMISRKSFGFFNKSSIIKLDNYMDEIDSKLDGLRRYCLLYNYDCINLRDDRETRELFCEFSTLQKISACLKGSKLKKQCRKIQRSTYHEKGMNRCKSESGNRIL